MAELSSESLQHIVDLARSSGTPQIADANGIPFAVIPGDAKIESLEKFVFNEHAERPERIKTTVEVLDPQSFCEYHNRFADAASRIFAYEPESKVTAVLDYHETHSSGDGARWCQHKLVLTLRESEQWKVWFGANNRQFTQMAFAEFLEQNSIDITRPSPAAIIDVARDLEAHTEVQFGAGVRTQDGQIRFKYTEETKATVGAGKVDVPERFTVNIPVYIGGSPIAMDALLRFRCKEGALTFWYTLVRPEEVKRTAFLNARQFIADELNVTVINGRV